MSLEKMSISQLGIIREGRGMNDLELFTMLMLGVVGCGLAFCGYVIGVVVQEAPNYEISNVGDE